MAAVAIETPPFPVVHTDLGLDGEAPAFSRFRPRPTFRPHPDILAATGFPAIRGLGEVIGESGGPGAVWTPRHGTPKNTVTGFFSEALAKSLELALDAEGLLDDALPPRTYGFGFVPNAGKKRWVNPCFRVSRHQDSFDWHRDLSATFEDGLSDYTLLVYLDAPPGLELCFTTGSGSVSYAGEAVGDELEWVDTMSPTMVMPVATGTAVLFSQRYLHMARAGSGTRLGSGGHRLVLRTDLVQPGTWAECETPQALDAKRVAQALFRNAQLAELAGFQDMASEMYQRSTHLRLRGSVETSAPIHPRALFLCDHYMELVDTGCTACVARSGTTYLFYHGRLYETAYGWDKGVATPIIAQAATFVLANMLSRDLPPLVFHAPLPIEDGLDDDGDMGGFAFGQGAEFDAYAQDSDDVEDYWGDTGTNWPKRSCGRSEYPEWPAAITAKHLIMNADTHTWTTLLDTDKGLGTTRIGTVKTPLFVTLEQYKRCYCGCDAHRPLTPEPTASDTPYERVSRAVFQAVEDPIPEPSIVFDEDDGAKGHVWFDMGPRTTSTFHHAACTGGYRVVGKREVGTVRHAVRCSMRFELRVCGLLCIVARPYVVL